MKLPKLLPVLLVLIGLCGVQSALADQFVWGNNASFGNVYLEEFNVTTGTLVQQFLLPNATARNDNGRGVAILGNTVYYTVAGNGNIYVTDATTHADLGVLVNTGFAGI